MERYQITDNQWKILKLRSRGCWLQDISRKLRLRDEVVHHNLSMLRRTFVPLTLHELVYEANRRG